MPPPDAPQPTITDGRSAVAGDNAAAGSDKQDKQRRENLASIGNGADARPAAANAKKQWAAESASMADKGVLPHVEVYGQHTPENSKKTPETKEAEPTAKEAEKAHENLRKDPDYRYQWAHLEHLGMENIKDKTQLSEFQANIKSIEAQAEKRHLSAKELADTYANISKVLDPKAPKQISQENAVTLAEQMTRQTAHPDKIDQGKYNSCNTTAMAIAMYTREPSLATDLVARAAAGTYKTHDGISVKLDHETLQPVGGAKKNPPDDGQRSYASQIFDSVAVNVANKHAGGSDVRYGLAQPKPGDEKWDNGERIYDQSKHPPQAVKRENGDYATVQGMTADIMAKTFRSIDPRVGKDCVLMSENEKKESGNSDGTTVVKSEKDLVDLGRRLKKDGGLPVVVNIDTGGQPFWDDFEGGKGGPPGGHAVAITDFHEGNPPKFEIDDSIGKAKDHLGAKAVDAHDLWLAMQPASAREKMLAHDNQVDEANHKPNLGKQADEIRDHFEVASHDTSFDGSQPVDSKEKASNEFAKSMSSLIDKSKEHWKNGEKDGTLTPAQIAQEKEHLFKAIPWDSLSPEASTKMMDQARSANLIPAKELGEYVGKGLADNMNFFDRGVASAGYQAKDVTNYADRLKNTQDFLENASADEKKAFYSQLSDSQKERLGTELQRPQVQAPLLTDKIDQMANKFRQDHGVDSDQNPELKKQHDAIDKLQSDTHRIDMEIHNKRGAPETEQYRAVIEQKRGEYLKLMSLLASGK